MALLRLDSLTRGARTTPAPAPEVDLMRTALSSALTEIRQICAGLRLPEMEAMALGDVIMRAVEEHKQKTGDTVRLSVCDGLPAADLAMKIALYRVTQEALNNVHAHAGVTEERVSVSMGDGSLKLEVVDHGKGMAVSQGDPQGRQVPGSPLGMVHQAIQGPTVDNEPDLFPEWRGPEVVHFQVFLYQPEKVLVALHLHPLYRPANRQAHRH